MSVRVLLSCPLGHWHDPNGIVVGHHQPSRPCTAVQAESHSARWLTENVREALEWDSIPNMLYGLKDGKEVLKMCVSALKSACWNFAKFGKVQKNTLYVCFITRQGVARPNVDTVYIVYQRLLHLCFNFCFFFVFKPIFTEHP